MNARKICNTVAAAALLLSGAPAHAQSAAAAGIVAGLGLTAAGGKTTLSGSAGTTEATLLSTSAIADAGQRIHAAAGAAAGDRSVLVLARGDAVDFTSVRWMKLRIASLTAALHGPCNPPKPAPTPPAHGKLAAHATPAAGGAAGLKASPADVAGLLATDVSISGITFTDDDRLLVSAVAQPIAFDVDPKPGPGAAAPTFAIPGEFADVSDAEASPGGLLGDFLEMQRLAGTKLTCTLPEMKSALADEAAFVSSVSSATKGQAPIMVAAQLDQMVRPLVLRVAIEASGGTATVRSNIWYQLGIRHDAATVSAGILASYRLTDPRTGEVKASGLVRCLTNPVALNQAEASLAKPSGEVCQGAATPS